MPQQRSARIGAARGLLRTMEGESPRAYCGRSASGEMARGRYSDNGRRRQSASLRPTIIAVHSSGAADAEAESVHATARYRPTLGSCRSHEPLVEVVPEGLEMSSQRGLITSELRASNCKSVYGTSVRRVSPCLRARGGSSSSSPSSSAAAASPSEGREWREIRILTPPKGVPPRDECVARFVVKSNGW